ncbi:MAG: methyltransferase domain-containing protein [Candidatus Aenigmarchaeota archaeon]|nr:methyltransferase domain-containing protein [Candidatus Aenigmarchaeota archaeon]
MTNTLNWKLKVDEDNGRITTKPSNISNDSIDIVKYDDLNKFKSYWKQIREIVNLKPKSVLEVGIGTGFLSNYLKSAGIEVTTLDVDKNRNPDIISDIRGFESSKKFDVVCLFEVLEHMPFSHISQLFEKLRHYSNYIIVSLPVCTQAYRFLTPKMNFIVELPIRNHNPKSKYHFWELEKTTKQNLEDVLNYNNIKIVRQYRYKENTYNYFYILKVGKSKV